ncbi:AAA family ATPase [Amycolatopsis sp. cg5]|uniref:AAA family ATPase n=1 Tax=Amycolatopsis sp. cg5 TaxID=3238802 RepID=UPI00352577E6
MLTRIEIDGFKSFDQFGLDLPPFLVVLGQNASGKSNLFDAIRLLSRLVTAPSVLDGFSDARGELKEQFRRLGDGSSVTRMRFAAEMLLEPTVIDKFGKQVQIRYTRIRYELEIRLVVEEDGFVMPYVEREFATSLLNPGSPLLETHQVPDDAQLFALRDEDTNTFVDFLPADAAEGTVLSTIGSAGDFPSLFATRKEIESWRFLQLDPVALRKPSTPDQRGEQLESTGANLARVLRRIERATKREFGSGLDDIAVDLVNVVRGVSRVDVTENAAGQWEVHLTTRDGRISARVASDGTLRVLALLAAIHDPQYRGLLCFEEPENGIFPQRLRVLVQALKESITEVLPGEPRAQLLLSSHSPLMLFELDPVDIVVMDLVTRVRPEEPGASQVSRARVLAESGELETVSPYERQALPGISRDEAQRLLED